ncbi:hypothetical protein PROFUN_06793 [Planoprotostelium fungivorum]|uniref:Transmembrane protein n=1 Tax=Planoprotostelium fungivorum TaxID=1890364 RepID=A0A2P6NNM7_9EUKA|nr:hypothetical protein PROFUN_06793 [Planoprotostelium fungivorum]
MVNVFSAEKLETMTDMWVCITVWNSFAIGILYFLWGMIATWRFNRHMNKKTLPLAFLSFPIIATAWGLFVGLVTGVLYAAAIAFLYVAGDFNLSWRSAAIWGSALALAHLLLSLIQTYIPIY